MSRIVNGMIAMAALTLVGGCHVASQSALEADGAGTNARGAITQILPQDTLSRYKSALPKVAFPELQGIFEDPDTLWYDHEVMKSVYQDSNGPELVGVQSNEHWFELLAGSLHGIGDKIYDRSKSRWQFPFATTAGTDESTNVQVVNFIHFPKNGDQFLPLVIWIDQTNRDSSWAWMYPNGTTLGEVLLIKDGSGLVPSEVRIRKRFAGGWATNVFRPFPEAKSLATAIKAKRANWQSTPQLRTLVEHLERNDTLTSKTLSAKGLTGTFDQTGALDVLPDFGDRALVKELLTTTTFISAYGASWKENGGMKAYAASTNSDFSIVPVNYQAGVIEVNDTSCMRCHKDTARMLDEWYPDITLYGEIWGRDAIFSFQPFDESQFPYLNMDTGGGVRDNRKMNPKLKAMGLIESYDASKHTAPFYTSKR